MKLVSKDELNFIFSRLEQENLDIRVAITCKEKKSRRKKFYIEERKIVNELLDQYRNGIKN